MHKGLFVCLIVLVFNYQLSSLHSKEENKNLMYLNQTNQNCGSPVECYLQAIAVHRLIYLIYKIN